MGNPIDLKVNAVQVKARLNRWGIKVDNVDLEKLIVDALGLSESDSYDDVIVDISVSIKTYPSSIEIVDMTAGQKTKDERIAELEALVKQYEETLDI